MPNNTNNIRLLASATVLPLLAMLAGCVGSSVSTPLTPGLSGASPTPAASSTASPSPSVSGPVAATWTFGGSTANLVTASGQTPAAVTLSAYHGITSTLQFGAVTSGSGTITVTDALNSAGDVTPATLPADNATTGATPMAYVSFYNGTSANISFGTMTPQVQITDQAGFNGATTCELDVYASNNGSALAWVATGATGTIAGTSVTINPVTLAGGNTVDFKPGQSVTAIACK